MKKRTFPIEFKHESASLVVDKGYCPREACDAVGVSQSAMRRWVKQLKEERNGTTPDEVDESVTIQGHAIRFCTVNLGDEATKIREQLLRLLPDSFRGESHGHI